MTATYFFKVLEPGSPPSTKSGGGVSWSHLPLSLCWISSFYCVFGAKIRIFLFGFLVSSIKKFRDRLKGNVFRVKRKMTGQSSCIFLQQLGAGEGVTRNKAMSFAVEMCEQLHGRQTASYWKELEKLHRKTERAQSVGQACSGFWPVSLWKKKETRSR